MNNITSPQTLNASDQLKNWRCRFDSLLSQNMSTRWQSLHPCWRERLLYSLNHGGKRVRALLIYAVGKSYNLPLPCLDPIAQAVEMVHTYSLIHDDLPAMDDDSFRRGFPSAHKAYNEADAILIGDGLLSDAFHKISTADVLSPLKRLKLIELLSFASGPSALVYGQWLDLCQKNESFEQLTELHQKKTGMLFAFCLQSSAIVSGHTEALPILGQIGLDLGLAFQIQDDLLDLLPMAHTGKSSGKDEKQGKKTAVTLLGFQSARNLSDELYTSSIQSLQELLPQEHLDELMTLIELLRTRKI